MSKCICLSCNTSNCIPSLSSHAVCFTMPSSGEVQSEWKMNPLSVVSRLFQKHHETGSWERVAAEFFENELRSTPPSEIPSLNVTPNHDFVDGQIVRFRCMIQDMFDPEFYFAKFQVKDLSSGELRYETGRYRDTAPCGPQDEALLDSHPVENGDRLSFYCVSVPCETPWTLDGYRRSAPVLTTPSCSSNHSRLKRSLDQDEEDDHPVMEVDESVKKPKTEDIKTETTVTNNVNALNLPIPTKGAKAAIVKVYDIAEGTFCLNDVVEFIGILSLDPSLASEDDPPPSLVPRLHVLSFRKLSHSNVLLPDEIPKPLTAHVLHETLETRACRSEILEILRGALFGDVLSAEYLLCHLVSHVYGRLETGLCLGKYSMNLFHIPLDQNYTKRLANLLQHLLEKCHYLPLSVQNLNSLVCVPRKDYQANRLISGFLQLSANTHLILDETAMETGQLTVDGLKNITAIGTMINWQKVEYNFSYHQIEFSTDVPCLVLSEGRSMLPSDVQVMLKPTEIVNHEERFTELCRHLFQNIDLLNKLRKYLTLVRHIKYDLNEEIRKGIQEDFVRERQSSHSVTADELSERLVLARLVSLTHGNDTLTPEVWERVKAMERERRERVASLPPRQARPLGPGGETAAAN